MEGSQPLLSRLRPHPRAASAPRQLEKYVRLLLVTDAWFPQVNGVVRAISTVRQRLLDLGHEVEVLSPERYKNVPRPTYPEIRLALCTPGMVGDVIAGYGPDAVHIVTEGPLGWCARAWLKRRGIPFSTSFHTMFPLYLKMRFKFPESWSFSLLRKFHSAAAVTMYSTPTLRDLLASQGFTNLTAAVTRNACNAYFV